MSSWCFVGAVVLLLGALESAGRVALDGAGTTLGATAASIAEPLQSEGGDPAIFGRVEPPSRSRHLLVTNLVLAVLYGAAAIAAQWKWGREAVPWPVVGVGLAAVLTLICLFVGKEQDEGAGILRWLYALYFGVPLAIVGAMASAWALIKLVRLPPAPVCVIASAVFAVLIVKYASSYW